jgi:hypothetical protein
VRFEALFRKKELEREDKHQSAFHVLSKLIPYFYLILFIFELAERVTFMEIEGKQRKPLGLRGVPTLLKWGVKGKG